MKLASCRKRYQQETHRTRSPEDTYAIIRDLVVPAGITRVADITGLDRLGIPVFSCIRPDAAEGSISVYNGKGATEIAARVSAIMEGLERYSAELHDRTPEVATVDHLKDRQIVNPEELILPLGVSLNFPIPWYPAYDIMQNQEVLVPAHAIFHPVQRTMGQLFRTSTNGIASGNTLEEAIFHALCEIIERDAWSLAEAANKGGPIITSIENPTILALLNRFRDAGVEITLRDISSDIGLPTVAAVADDVMLRDPTLLCIGMGTHAVPEIAILRALTEAAQSRATQIHGAREDTQEGHMKRQIGYDRTKRLNKKWFENGDTIDLAGMYSYRSDDFLDDIIYTLKQLEAVGITRVLVTDLTRPEIGIPVVRVIVPGLEHYAMDRDRLGDRCRSARRNYLPGSKPVAE
ncbi:MAG: YcaO-related McrA-glycine thioamidation protein [Methanospirillum sp.]|uniref:YcaO-related McrA-glycine thioamidation protein n=1 Tax=Methanospirillum sp. TaxID=45200 RepID=UPI00236E0144|nr:YcaO-related McrA-glycine thioamidation protein [Methanospirillum sp.]MDD1730458.1 YcaO-related McrA-glycine thioamidation protein [Methanospirillum sp.]